MLRVDTSRLLPKYWSPLALLNSRYGAAFPGLDLAEVARADPVASYRPAEGPVWSESQLPRPLASTRGDGGGPLLRDTAPRARARRPSAPLVKPHPEEPLRLQLPARLEQVLPLSKAASYFGDGIAAQNARDERTIRFGGGSLLFGGLAIVDTHLEGDLRIRFSPPQGDLTHPATPNQHDEPPTAQDDTITRPRRATSVDRG